MNARKIERTRPTGQQLPAPPKLEPRVESIRIGTPPESVTPELPKQQTPVVTDSGGPAVPKYQRMIRKEARIRPDQADQLTALRRRVSKARGQRVEPITDNTLLRVAVDLLLAHADELAGDTEDELRYSVTNRVTE